MIEHARLAGDDLMETRLLTDLAMCALYGPNPVPAAIEQCRELLERTGRDRKAEAITLAVLAELEAMLWNFDGAREVYRKSRASLDELGWRFHAALTSIHSGSVELLAGDPIRAESELRRDYDDLEAMHERNYSRQRPDSSPRPCTSRSGWRKPKASPGSARRSLLPTTCRHNWLCVPYWQRSSRERGCSNQPSGWLGKPVQQLQASEEPVSQGYALMSLTQVLRSAGKEDEAIVAIKQAIELLDKKGNLVAAKRARDLLSPSRTPSLGRPQR
ncbi:MAG: hypothetical protein ACRDGP_07530 [Actinomycetota bacterium]